MATKRIQLTEWLPDQPAIGAGLQDAKNVVPVTAGYAPFPTPVNFSLAATENLNNVAVGKLGTEVKLFAGSSTKLWKLDATTLGMVDASYLTGAYGGTSRWSFAQFGAVVVGANGHERIQAFNINTSTRFADLSANAPIAKYVAVVRDFVVGANILDYPNKLQWSDINDETNWVSSTTSQSDFQIISDGGNITGITGGEFGLVLLEKAVYRMSYIGSPLFFQFDAISRNLGCLEGGSVAQFGGITYFLSDDGFYSCDGRSITPIGAEKVDKYFFGNFAISKSDTMSATVDPVRKLIIWNYPTVGGQRALIIYNWQLQRWSRGDTDVDYVSSAATTGVTLETLATTFSVLATALTVGQKYEIVTLGTTTNAQWNTIAGTSGVTYTVGKGFTCAAVGVGTGTATSIELLTTSMDDRVYAGGKFVLAGVRGQNIITFTGTNAAANIILSDIEDGYNSTLTLARPQIDGGSSSVTIASRRELSDIVSFNSNSVAAGSFVVGQRYVITSVGTTSFTSIGALVNTVGTIFTATAQGSGTGTADKCSGEGGRISLRSSGRYHRLSVTPIGSWTTAIAVDVTTEPRGGR